MGLETNTATWKYKSFAISSLINTIDIGIKKYTQTLRINNKIQQIEIFPRLYKLDTQIYGRELSLTYISAFRNML
jgi:hypothetical protein